MDKPILLVEDEALLLEVLREDLADLGYATVCASDFDEALETLEQAGPLAGLLTDIRMPGAADGWELARRARALRPDLPIIYLSGYSGEAQEPVAGSVFLRKPCRLPELAAALARLCPPSANPALHG